MELALFSIFIVSYFLHLTSRFPALGAIRFDLLVGGATLVAAFLKSHQDTLLLRETTSRRLNMFLLYIFLSLPLVTWPGSVIKLNLEEWVKAACFFLLVIGTIRTEKQLRWLMIVFLSCQIFRTLEPLYLHITTGYWGDLAYSQVGGIQSVLKRLSGAPHDIVNPNQLAWVIVNTVPFLFYLLWCGKKWGKLLFLAWLPAGVYCLLLTGSRSGLLSLAVTVLGIILMSKKRGRNLIITMAVLLPVTILVLGSLAPDLRTRYLSLIDSSVAGADTAHGRVHALFVQATSISDNPLFGHGLGTSGETNVNVLRGSSQVTHNLYIEILQETGLIGFSLFLAIIVSIVKSLKKAKKLLLESGEDGTSWLFRLISATQVWVFMDLFYSLSCFGLRSWEWYFFGGITTVCLVLAREVSSVKKNESVKAANAI